MFIKPFIKEVAQKLGIDKAIFFTSLARVIQAAGGIISILFVARYLTSEEQGFYYTFGSIVAIQVFFELGLNGIITQYVAHETAHLQWNGLMLVGENKYLSRLSSLLHFCVKWYLWFAAALLVTLLMVGFSFFTRFGAHDDISWQVPWIFLAVGTTLNLLLTPILAFIEGLGMVKEVARIRLFQQILSLLIVWFGLFVGAKLFVSGFSCLASVCLIAFMLWSKFRKILLGIWRVTLTDKVNYRLEIFPYQWKIALSWVSGYFIFQLFNPVLFATEGAAVAGQMGMTLAVLNGIQSLSISWITTKVPLFSSLIARHEYTQLDVIFNRTLKQSVFINGGLLIVMLVGVFIIRHSQIMIGGIDLGNRFLPYLPMVLMMIPLFVNQFVNSWATYLRCHKQEPFLLNSVVSGILCCLSTILLGNFWGVVGITVGYCLIVVVMSFWGHRIFVSKKREWHIYL